MKWGSCENEKCGKFRKLYKSKHTDKYVCVPCHDKDPFYHKRCSQCSLKRKVALRTVKILYCHKCPICGRKSPIDEKSCHFCTGEKPIEKKLISYFCAICSSHSDYKKQHCSQCGEKRHIHSRSELDDSPICDNCYNKNLQDICSRCGYPERIVARVDGKPLGVNCWQRERRKQKKILAKSLTRI